MTRLQAIEKSILSLPKSEYDELRRWFLQRDWEEWDRHIEEDAASGKLDFLVREAAEGRRKGNLRKL